MRRYLLEWLAVAGAVAANSYLAVVDWPAALLYAPFTVGNVVLFIVQVWDS